MWASLETRESASRSSALQGNHRKSLGMAAKVDNPCNLVRDVARCGGILVSRVWRRTETRLG